MPAGVKKKRRRYRNESDSVTARFISDSSSDSDFEVRIPHVKYSDYKKKSKGCTTTEKSLCAVIVVFIVICVVLAALLVAQFVLNGEGFKKQKTCMSPSCVEVAGKLLSRMDLNEEPCTDFYQYSCGAWLADFTLPPDKSSFSMFTYVNERNTARLRELLVSEGSLLVGQNSTAIKKSKYFYKACMDTKSVEERGIKPMLQRIKDLGSWTLTSGESGTWDESSWNLLVMLTTLHKKGGSGLFDMSVAEDLRNVDEHIIQFDQSGLTFGDRTFYLDEQLARRYYAAFRNYFASVTVLLGADNATAYQVADDIWQFEKLIANITTPPEDRQDMEKLYHKMTVADLQTIMGDWISLRDYLKAIFGFTISQSREIIVYAPEFLGKIGGIVTATSKRTLANYLVWHGMSGGISYLPYVFHQADLALSSALSGVSARPPEWKICVSRSTNSLPQATGALFVEKYFSSQDREKAGDILKRIKADFRAKIPDLDWMDEVTKQRAIEKVDAVQDKIGFPDMAQDPPMLDAYYEKMVVTDDDSFQNWINLNDFYMQKALQKLSKKPDRNEWYMAPNEVNAYYSPSTNQMVFPAGILQFPFYDPSFPMAVNYGSIGMVMGHELTHGFDNSGRQYDQYGNLKVWWNEASADAFLQRTKCIINQYNQFTVGKKNVNGRLTQGENIADNGGIKTAFGAYQTWLDEHGGQEKQAILPALNMTEVQAFFLGFGQIWCSFSTPEQAEQSLTTDVHSPHRARVLGSLQNMQEFSDTFQCRPGTPMNAKTKCVIW